MIDSRWVMNRAGLLNFWYYDNEIFHFSDGKLLLRGTNGSGKSVTMQSFLPVLLDGKKTPDRLDPFGSKARRMEDYLLGEKDVVDRDERTGYLFLEYKKRGSDQYITTGIGMQAKRQKGIKSWYFLITDNRRISYDFELAHTQRGEYIPYSAKELEDRISLGGHVVHGQREYMELVNKHVFGFQALDAYEDLIKLLIQLRSPKLSKDFKPTVIYEILESALPPLTDDELRHLSDTIESMDQAQQQLEQLEREHESAEKLVRHYDLYNRFIIAERAEKWQKASGMHLAATLRVKELEGKEKELVAEISRLESDRVLYERQIEVNREEQERLQQHEVWRLEKEKANMEERLISMKAEVAFLKNKWDGKRNQLNLAQKEKENEVAEYDKHKQDLAELLVELEVDAVESAFSRHGINLRDFERLGEDLFDFTVWKREARGHGELLEELKRLAEDKDRLMEEHGLLERLSSEKKKEIDELRKDLDHLEQWFIEQKQALSDEVFRWIAAHKKLHFQNERVQAISRAIEGLYERSRFENVREEILASLNDYMAEIRSAAKVAEKELEAKQLELDHAIAERERWKTLKMPNPDRADDTEVFRQKLTSSGRAHLPFYAAVEFRDGLSDMQKSRIEAALKQTGLLDSLIADTSVDPEHDRVIRPEPMLLGHTLADFLRPDVDANSPVSEAIVDEVLRSIPLEQSGAGFHLDVDGSYSVGCIIGHAPDEGPSKFIGRSSRKRFQQEKIEEWERTVQELRMEADEIGAMLLEYETEIQNAELWKVTIPSDKALSEIHIQMEGTERVLKQEQETLVRYDKQWLDIHQKVQAVRQTLHQKGNGLNLDLTADMLTSALKASNSYERFLNEAEKTWQACFYTHRRIMDLQEGIREREAELDEIKGEENSRSFHIEKCMATIESIERQLKLEGIEDIRARIREVQRLLKEADEKMKEIHEGLPAKREIRKTNANLLKDAEKSASFWLRMSAEWEAAVRNEAARGFTEIGEVEASCLLDFFGSVLDKHDRPKLNEQLTKTFLNEQSNLTEYRMFEFTEEADWPEWFAEDWGDYYEPFKSEWEQLRGRRLIQLEYRGQRVSPYTVLAALEKELIDQKGWLDEQDRQLYEDIIVNHVGVILRNRIQRAEKWIREMDGIMKKRDNSSGLTFSVAWKPLTAESEEELDTKDLVGLLQRNSKFLNEEDLNRITGHFQSRIAKAKEMIQLRNEGSTLHQVLKEVLDYRKWFTFVLSYTRVNEPKRELTNNAFFKFSGGEKAMAMYIPLFTAAYSRYKEAGEMAPYIITLDEAFAGVDEQNIRDMFEVVEQLGFDYIMNSQALWGDYDTISSLAICELVRPKNAGYVTVIRYEWDGKQRSIVIDSPEGGMVTHGSPY